MVPTEGIKYPYHLHLLTFSIVSMKVLFYQENNSWTNVTVCSIRMMRIIKFIISIYVTALQDSLILPSDDQYSG